MSAIKCAAVPAALYRCKGTLLTIILPDKLLVAAFA
jgi:hypothetical protein